MKFVPANPAEGAKPIVLYRYHLPSIDGEGWAIITLCPNGTFSALSDWGNYGYYWSNPGCEFRKFLTKSDDEYFISKFSAGERVYDGVATTRAIKEYIVGCRRRKSWSREKARDEWDLLEHHSDVGESDVGFARWFDDTTISSEEACELHVRQPAPQLVAFVQRVMPRLAALLKQELAAEAAAAEAPATAVSA